MQNWIISPEKYLTDEEVNQLRLTLNNAVTLAKTRDHRLLSAIN